MKFSHIFLLINFNCLCNFVQVGVAALSHRAVFGFLFCFFLSSLMSGSVGYPTNVRTGSEMDVSLFVPQPEGMSSKLAVYLPK